MRIHLTYDIEVWCDGWHDLDKRFAQAYRRYVYGPAPQESGALPLNLQVLRDNGLKAIFFVEPLFSFRFGLGPLQELVGLILEAGQEVQMHLHPEWLDELDDELVPRRSKTPHLHRFDLADQTTLIGHGVRRLVEAGAPRPTAFRAGGFSMNADTLHALRAHDIQVDSSVNAAFDFPYPIAAPQQRFQCSQMEGLAEFPVTIFVDGLGRQRPLQVTACSNAEFESALYQARGLGMPCATLVSHNFELLNADRTKVDRIAVRRFEKLCKWLGHNRADLTTASFDAALAPEIPPALDLPRVSMPATAARYVEQAARRLF